MKNKKLFTILIFVLFFSFMAYALTGNTTYIYDTYSDGIINTTLWLNESSSGTRTLTENAGSDITLTTTGTGNIVITTNTSWLPSVNLIQNLSFHNILTSTQGAGTCQLSNGGIANLFVFGNLINSSCPGSTTQDHTYNLIRQSNGNFQVYADGILINTITPSNNLIRLVADAGALGGSASNTLYVVSYTTINSTINTTLLTPPNNTFSINSSNLFSANFTFNPQEFAHDFRNATLYIWNSSGGIFNRTTNIITGNYTNSTNWTISNFDIGVYKWNVYSCGNDSSTICSFSDSNRTFTYGLVENSVSYNSSSIISRLEGFVLNASVSNPSALSSVNFVFNGISESASYSLQGSNIIVSNSKTSFSAGSYPFYWSFNFSGTIINTTTYTQAVSSISSPIFSSSSCSGGGYNNVYNFTVFDESNQTQINSTQFSYVLYYGLTNGYSLNTSGSSTSKNLYLCMNFTGTSSWKIGYGEINYQSEPVASYPLRKYLLFQNTTITNTTQNNVSLYSIPLAQQTTFDLTVIERSTLLPYVGYYISLLRWYPATNEYKIVDMGVLDETGQTPIHVIVEDIDYRIAVYQSDGTLIHLANPRRLICLISPCEYTLSIEGETIDLNEFLDIQNLLSFNETTGIWTFIWNDPSQRTSFMNLTVWQDFGDSSRVICSTGSSAYTGIITCNTSGYTGKLRGEVRRSASPPIIIAQLIEDIFSSPFKSKIGLFITFLMSAVIIFAVGYISPVFAVLAGIISLIPALYLGSLSYFVISALAGLGGVILHVLNRV